MISKCIHIVYTGSSIEMDARVLKMASSYSINGYIDNEIIAIHYPSGRDIKRILLAYFTRFKLFCRRRRGSTFNFYSFLLIFLLAWYLFRRLLTLRISNSLLRLHFHDIHFILLIPLARFFSALSIAGKVNITLDLHELPYPFILRNQFLSLCLVAVFGLCDKLIFTNDLRRRYVLKAVSRFPLVRVIFPLEVISGKFFVVENYPAEAAGNINKDFSGSNSLVWPKGRNRCVNYGDTSLSTCCPDAIALTDFHLKNLPYILWIGPCVDARMFPLFCHLMSTLPSHVSVVILGAKPSSDDLIALSGRDVYALSVPSSEVQAIIQYSLAVPVFYSKHVNANNRMCSPNKFFDALFRGTPVFGPTCLSFDCLKKDLIRLGCYELLDKCLIADPLTLFSDFPGFINKQLQNFPFLASGFDYRSSYPREWLWNPPPSLFD